MLFYMNELCRLACMTQINPIECFPSFVSRILSLILLTVPLLIGSYTCDRQSNTHGIFRLFNHLSLYQVFLLYEYLAQQFIAHIYFDRHPVMLSSALMFPERIVQAYTQLKTSSSLNPLHHSHHSSEYE